MKQGWGAGGLDTHLASFLAQSAWHRWASCPHLLPPLCSPGNMHCALACKRAVKLHSTRRLVIFPLLTGSPPAAGSKRSTPAPPPALPAPRTTSRRPGTAPPPTGSPSPSAGSSWRRNVQRLVEPGGPAKLGAGQPDVQALLSRAAAWTRTRQPVAGQQASGNQKPALPAISRCVPASGSASPAGRLHPPAPLAPHAAAATAP